MSDGRFVCEMVRLSSAHLIIFNWLTFIYSNFNFLTLDLNINFIKHHDTITVYWLTPSLCSNASCNNCCERQFFDMEETIILKTHFECRRGELFQEITDFFINFRNNSLFLQITEFTNIHCNKYVKIFLCYHILIITSKLTYNWYVIIFVKFDMLDLLPL